MLRIEDLDTPRVLARATQRQMDDLQWLGLRWDEGPEQDELLPNDETAGIGAPYTQSLARTVYAKALATLHERGLLYPCDCSRKEIASLTSAPHDGEEIRYAGTCVGQSPHRAMRRPAAWRLRVDQGAVESFTDLRLGPQRAPVSDAAGDFVLQRGDGTYTYQFACAVDDGRAQITDVVRGEDLLGSTARQRRLQRLLGLSLPRNYLHIPLIVGTDGARLAKRHRAPTVQEMRLAGRSPESIIGETAYLLGLQERPAEAPPSAFMGMIPVEKVMRDARRSS